MKKILLSLLITISITFADLKYKTFNTIEEAIDHVATIYKDAAYQIGGNTWWSTHRIVAIPYEIFMPPGAAFGKISCRYVVYWREQ